MLGAVKFRESIFVNCDFSNAHLDGVAFQEVTFTNCKLLGLQFERCHDFGFAATFEDCQLNYSTFYRMNLRHCAFRNAQLQQVDFTEADLQGISLVGCDLSEATFDRTDLTQADFTAAKHYRIDPNQNKIRGALFSLPDVIGLLAGFGIEIRG